jgi:hypothetical protein
LRRWARSRGGCKSVNEATTDLAKNTSLLELHAEDVASRLQHLEEGIHGRRAEGKEPVTPTTTVVPIDAHQRPTARWARRCTSLVALLRWIF